MAMIHCPECDSVVSDKAKVCPKCAYPLEEVLNFGKIKIKLCAQTNGFHARQKVTIKRSSGKVIWEGTSGEIAQIDVLVPTHIKIKYHTSLMANLWGGSTEGIVDPNKWNKYNVSAKKGLVSNIVLTFHGVDMFDSD